jgi:tetratricopeptide (TPR) repeat protein/tRNA A-37 threonylcarbamoyl transferase component Bud32
MIGKTVAHYKIVEQIGEGGMGVVYKAEDTKLHRTVALKFLSPATVATEADKDRFAAEARAAASLDHPNICTVYEINEFEGQSYIAMAYIEGRSLREEIDDAALGINRALDIAVQVAKGLAAAHERGIVHRDIKSANIMVTPKGDAKIMDFGIAHRPGAAAVPTEDLTTAGTLAYSSPEQLQNDEVDRRSDLWSFGVTLYEMIAGQPPFRGDYPSAMAYSIQSEPPEALTTLRPNVPKELERIVNRALAKNREDRYQSADEMHGDLRALQIERDPTISKVLSGVAGARRDPWYNQVFTRRSLVAAVVYAVAVYAAVQLTSWLVSRYVWSPHLTGIVALTLISFLPSAVLIAATSTRTAGRGALAARSVGIPLNVVVAVALVFAFFAGKDLGAATTTVSVTDEDGNTLERVIPKGEFRKKTAVFFFENESGDSTLAWIHQAIPVMLQIDLYQDPFVVFRSGMEPAAVTRLKRAGFNNWERVPVALLQKIAGELYTDYFLTGSYSYEGGEYSVRMALHDTGTGNLVSERIVRNQNLFAMVDAMTVWLKRELGLPEGHIEQVKDLPVAGIVTDSEAAMRMYVSGQARYLLENDSAAMIRGAERAVAEDSTFALAYLALYVMYRINNRAEEAGRAIDKVMTFLYKLPERQQYVAKALYYDYKQDPDRYLAVLEMLVELYPDDLQSRGILAGVYTHRREIDKAIEQYQLALEFDPYNFEFLSGMVDLYVDQAKFDDALEVLTAYAEAQPEDIAALIKSGEVNETRGDLDAAGRAYDRALIIDPANVEVLLKLSAVETKTGDFGAAVRHFDDALKLAKSPEDRYSVYDGLADYYEIRGQPRRVVEATEKMLDQAEHWLPPLQAQFIRLVTLDRYVEAGQTERAFALRDSLGGLIAPPLDKLAAIGDVGINLALDRPAEAAASLIVLEEAVDAMRLRALDQAVWRAKGDIAVLEGDHETAIANFEEQLALEPSKTSILRKIGGCQRELGRYEEARESIMKRLATHPMDPEAHYELALVFAEIGDMSKALEHLRRALEVWQEADPDYEPARKAREKMKEWQAATSL